MLHPKSRETASERKNEVLRAMATERLSLRAAERVFGVARHTISRWPLLSTLDFHCEVRLYQSRSNDLFV